MSWRLSRERYPLMRVALCAELGDFEVATTGGFWVAAGDATVLDQMRLR